MHEDRGRAITAIVFSVSLLACKKPPPPAPDVVDAATPTAVVTAAPNVDAGTTKTPAPEAPIASDDFTIVARGKSAQSKLIWLTAMGSRVWLSGHNLDAFADGPGPLVKGRDPFEKLDYKPGTHSLQVAGHYPHIYALRLTAAQTRTGVTEPVVFVYSAPASPADPGTWARAKPLAFGDRPWAFLPYRGGALFVSSQVQGNSMPGYSEDKRGAATPGTEVELVGPDGSVTTPALGINQYFLAWAGASDGESISLLGTAAVKAKADGDGTKHFDSVGVQLLRIPKDGAKSLTAITHVKLESMAAYGSAVKEHDGKTLVIPPRSNGSDGDIVKWKPTPQTLFYVDSTGKAVPRAVPATTDLCSVTDADFIGDSTYAVEDCVGDKFFYRIDGKNKAVKVALPKLGNDACVVEKLVLRGPDDLWATGLCGQIPVVLRHGRPQTPPIEIP